MITTYRTVEDPADPGRPIRVPVPVYLGDRSFFGVYDVTHASYVYRGLWIGSDPAPRSAHRDRMLLHHNGGKGTQGAPGDTLGKPDLRIGYTLDAYRPGLGVFTATVLYPDGTLVERERIEVIDRVTMSGEGPGGNGSYVASNTLEDVWGVFKTVHGVRVGLPVQHLMFDITTIEAF